MAKVPAPQNRLSLSPRKAALQNGETTPVRLASSELGIHNFSNVKLTERQARVLGMGLKFRPLLKSPTAAEFDLQIKDFCRRVRLHALFADQPQDPNFNP